ncbi:MAG: TRAP transporter small permease subunit [Pseudomonadota bacterium]
MKTLLSFANVCERIVVRIGEWSSFLILQLIAVIMYDVVSRKFQFIQQMVLNSPLYDYISPTKLQELEWHLHAVIFLLAFGYGYFCNTHVRVDLLREKMHPRRQAAIELIGLIAFALPYLLIMGFYTWEFASSSFAQGEGSDALTGLPHRWVIKSFLLIGICLMLMAVISIAIRLLAYLSGSPEIQERSALALKNLIPEASTGSTALKGGNHD